MANQCYCYNCEAENKRKAARVKVKMLLAYLEDDHGIIAQQEAVHALRDLLKELHVL